MVEWPLRWIDNSIGLPPRLLISQCAVRRIDAHCTEMTPQRDGRMLGGRKATATALRQAQQKQTNDLTTCRAHDAPNDRLGYSPGNRLAEEKIKP